MDIVNNQKESSKMDSELLFLITQTLKSIDGFADAAALVEQRLNSNGMLGEITSWDGQTRNTTVEDYQKRFSSVGSSHLKYHLENSLKSATSAQSSESKSLLSQLVGFFDASDLAHIVASKELTSNLANLYVNLRTSKHTQRLLKDRKVYLETTLTLQRESQQYEESDDSSNSSSDVICLDEKIVPVLKEVGKSKELTRVSLKMVDEQSKEIELRKEIDEVVLSLQHLGCAENSVDRGYVDSGLSWLHARSLGLISSCASLSRTLTSSANPSVRRIERMRLTKFNLQWTISGHMMNPTYCVLFDPSGKYVFTGADDYLVKLWDVEKGLLLRTFRGHMSYISHLVLSPDGSLMASGCTMGTIRLWRLSDGVCVQVLKHKASINWLMFDKHTGALASASDDGQCTVWDINRLLQDDLCDIPLLDVIARRMGCSSSHSFNTKSFTASMSNNKFDQCDEERIIIPSEVIGTKACNSARFFLPVLFEEPTSLDTSNHEDEVAALVLPHIQDYHQITSRTVEPSKVNCLDISPAGGVLVTGCEDGVARIWRFGSFTEGRGKRAKVKSMDSALSNLRYKVSPNEYSRILQVTSQLLLRLEGHIASITDVHFNQSGDRVLTASLKEGSVRVWSLSKDYTNSIQIALDLSLENSHSDQAVQNKETRIRGGRRQNTSKTEAYNACWTNDGNRIITLQSVPIKGSSSTRYEPTRLKVWDSITGDLLKVIRRVSDLSCRTLVVHPINPSIVLTCGEDGFINFWDIEEEKLLSNQKILDDDGTDTFLVDASFSNDGLQVVATDTNGRLSLLTLDNSNRYSTSYNQQYFSSDYANIMIDDMGFAIDVGTQLPVHESPAGALCRLDGTAYESQPILDTSLPPPRSKFDLETMFDECQKIREELPARLELTFKTFLRHSSHGRSAQRYQATKYKDSRISQVVEASKTNSSIEKSPTKYVAKYKEFDYNTLFSSSEDSANDSDYGRQRLSTRSQRLVRGSNRSQSNHVATLPTRSTRNRASYVDNDDDDDNDESYERATQSRSERLRARERRRMILSDDESECSASTVDSEQDVDLYDSDSEVVARRKTREKDRAKSAALKAKRNIRRKKSRRSAVASSDSLLHIQSCGWSKHRASVPVGVEIDRTWLLVDSCNENQYCPQLGDRVFYFPQGHAEFLKSFTESISPPWMSFQDRWPLVECEVTKITYEFPTEAEFRRCPSVVVNVGLVILQTPSRRSITSSGNYTLDLVEPRATRHSQQNLFTVSIRNCHLPDFLVLSEVFMRSVKIPWHFGVKISVQYKETNEDGDISFKQYMGSVVRLSNASDDWPNSPWEALEVRWDDEDGSIENAGANSVERLGPWEATPLLDSSSNSTATRAQYKLKTLDTAETSRIVEEVNKLMTENDEEYNPFMYEVDGSVYPDYYSLIATPSYVDLIVRRLENYFYRQVEALEFDINLLLGNCITYNSEGSDIVKVAEELTRKLHGIVRPPVDSSAMVSSSTDARQSPQESRNRKRSRVETDTRTDSLVNAGSTDIIPEDASLSPKLKINFKKRRQLDVNGDTAGDPSHSSVANKKGNANMSINLRQSSRLARPSKNNESESENEEGNERSSSEESDDDVKEESGSNEDSEASEEKESSAESEHSSPKKLNIRLTRASSNERKTTKQSITLREESDSDDSNQKKLNLRSTRQSTLRSTRRSSRQSILSYNEERDASEFDSEEEVDEVHVEDDEETVESVRPSRKRTKVSSAPQLKSSPSKASRHAAKSQNKTKRVERMKEENKFDEHRTKRIDPQIRKQLLDILNFAEELDEDEIFAEPVDATITPLYAELIQKPMDLSTIRNKINTRCYQSMQSLVEDLYLMYENCENYNDPDSIFGKAAVSQRAALVDYVSNL